MEEEAQCGADWERAALSEEVRAVADSSIEVPVAEPLVMVAGADADEGCGAMDRDPNALDPLKLVTGAAGGGLLKGVLEVPDCFGAVMTPE